MGVSVSFDYGAFLVQYPVFGVPAPGVGASALTGTSITGDTLTVGGVTGAPLAVGSLLSDQTGLLLPGTYIAKFLSGTPGGAGTYQVNLEQTVPSEAMSGAVPFISLAQVQALFAEATIFHRNDGTGPVTDATVQLTLLNMIVAHLAYLRYGLSGQPPSPLVGRISTASEGSVSVGVDMPAQPASAAWWQQTTYGAEYWQATMPYRTMRYVANPLPRARLGAGFGVWPWFPR